MECLLLLVDELDDATFTLAAIWRGACRLGLAAGFVAALVLTPLHGVELRADWTIALSAVAAGSVVAWLSAVYPFVRRSRLQPVSPA